MIKTIMKKKRMRLEEALQNLRMRNMERKNTIKNRRKKQRREKEQFTPYTKTRHSIKRMLE